MKLNKTDKKHKSLNNMPLHERMEYQRVYDHSVIHQAFMNGKKVEVKTLANKRSHPFALENMQNN